MAVDHLRRSVDPMMYLTCYYSNDDLNVWTATSPLAQDLDFMSQSDPNVQYPKDLDAGLNLIGGQDWDLVTAWPEPKGIRFVFRKEGTAAFAETAKARATAG